MPRGVSYRIEDRLDGLFDVVVTLDPGKVFRRAGSASRAEIDQWIEDLRALMAAIGAPVSPADTASIETPGVVSNAVHPANDRDS
ncbi:hypothetical protein ASF60_18860 [Methylobacterium sp. Leaf113]|nr:hypothetical protein ASF60_18860 [Methylobacterium sp. Leaf113]